LRVQATNSRPRFEVTCDGDGVVSHAGAALLRELADRLGLTTALSWRAGRGQTLRHRHGAGAVLRDLAVVLADGGDALSDLAVLRDQPELFGPVASTATAWRVVEQVAADELGLAGLRAARAQARSHAWQIGAWPDTDLLVVDVDGTLLDAHSPKQGAAGTYKHGFGFYPLLAFLDRGDGTGEALAGILRPGNAGSNTAGDHVELVDLALAQLPPAARAHPDRGPGRHRRGHPRPGQPPASAGRRVLGQPAL
jgi:Transposase DDE domain group 1